jgi:hypothetical protein
MKKIPWGGISREGLSEEGTWPDSEIIQRWPQVKERDTGRSDQNSRGEALRQVRSGHIQGQLWSRELLGPSRDAGRRARS